MKSVMAACGLAAMTIGCLAPEQTVAGERSSAGPLGALTVGTVSSASAAVPRTNYSETADTPTCHWTRGRPVWDPGKGIWVRPRLQVCD